MKELKIYNTLQVTIANESIDWTEDAMSYADEIAEHVKNENIDLAEYSDQKKLQHITMSVELINNKLYGCATCVVDNDWNDEDTNELKRYLTGQYSDGWGEGLEQREFSEWTEDEEIEEYDEEMEEYYTDVIEVRHYAYVNFWQPKTFKIFTKEEL